MKLNNSELHKLVCLCKRFNNRCANLKRNIRCKYSEKEKLQSSFKCILRVCIELKFQYYKKL